MLTHADTRGNRHTRELTHNASALYMCVPACICQLYTRAHYTCARIGSSQDSLIHVCAYYTRVCIVSRESLYARVHYARIHGEMPDLALYTYARDIKRACAYYINHARVIGLNLRKPIYLYMINAFMDMVI
jgi:hypothetical protein